MRDSVLGTGAASGPPHRAHQGERHALPVIASRFRRGGSTPPITGARAVAELTTVDLNGQPQWILVRGEDVANPLLLLLHGGPGESNMWLAHHSTHELERHFVCVHWDQRGTGKSFDPRPDPRTMTVAQFVDDTIALIELLRARFHQEKVLLLGHSWGSLLVPAYAPFLPDVPSVTPRG